MSSAWIRSKGDGRLRSFAILGGAEHEDDVAGRLGAFVGGVDKVLALHVHGGLVTPASAIASYATFAPAFEAAGGTPLAVVWDTGPGILLNNWKELLGTMAKDELFQRLASKILKWVLRFFGINLDDFKLGDVLERVARSDEAGVMGLVGKHLGSRGTLPIESVRASLEADVRADPDLAAAVPAAKGLAEPIRSEIPAGARGIPVATLALHAGKILVRVIARFAKHRDHGPWATIVEETARELYISDAGTQFWELIKRDAAQSFDAPGRTGHELVRILGASPRRVVVVAHSAGSIWACAFLDRMHAAGLRIDSLVLAAPAVRTDLFVKTWKRSGAAVEALTILNLTDARERGYWEIPGVYPRSLLYLVSGGAEREGSKARVDAPLVGMERFTSPPFPAGPAIKAMAAIRAKARLVEYDDAKHGEFLDDHAASRRVAAAEIARVVALP